MVCVNMKMGTRQMKVLAMIIAGVLVVLMGAWVAAGYLPVRNIETPKYAVLSANKEYEIRQYPGHIVAEVQVTGTYKGAVNKGFRKIADYIFGNNTASGSIAMTAPVLHEKHTTSEKIPMTAPVLHGKTGETDTYSPERVTESGTQVSAATGVQFLRQEKGRAVFRLGAGQYSLCIK